MLQEQMMLLYALPLDPKVKEAPEMAEFHRSQPPGRPEAAGLPCTKAARPDPCLFSGFGQIFNRFSCISKPFHERFRGKRQGQPQYFESGKSATYVSEHSGGSVVKDHEALLKVIS